MADMPDRVWVRETSSPDLSLIIHGTTVGTEYVRADLVEALLEALEWYGRGIKSVQTDAHDRGEHLRSGGDPDCPFCDGGARARAALARLPK